ncbi:hypothetical protein H0A61_00538 [Koleobacter methoxysyntrophicus]|uniref:Flavoprotein domain-containing protein n=1 Tax=Koleobacter methoxysyntrophicus TaxID=2751313 RepID=A0A8A0RKR8_9FIRM|nr:flavoprotein [Koleobacter methoxysyntrophicus]QSQ08218.1 hypothetical protein H0A61_00538 [Koleobacter methoxysyntrophicus]
MYTDVDSLIKIVIDEVIRQLKFFEEKDMSSYAIMAVFTGGRTGLEEALKQLKYMETNGAQLTIVPSRNALRIIGEERLKKEIPGAKLIYEYTESILQETKNADIILFPVLTQNTLAKIALGICDTLPLQIASWGIMMGKKMLAARNAADPGDSRKMELGLGRAPKVYRDQIYGYFDRLKEFEIHFCDVREMLDKTHQMLENKRKTTLHNGHALTHKDVITYTSSGVKEILIRKDSIITPLAVETAEKNQIILTRKEG